MRLFFLIWMSHHDKETHTYSLKICVYTQSRVAVALSLPIPSGKSEEGGSDDCHRTNVETPISHYSHIPDLCFLPPCFWYRRTCRRGKNFFPTLGACNYIEAYQQFLSSYTEEKICIEIAFVFVLF